MVDCVTGYFQERFWRTTGSGTVRRAGNYHRTLGTYLNTLARHGSFSKRPMSRSPQPASRANAPCTPRSRSSSGHEPARTSG